MNITTGLSGRGNGTPLGIYIPSAPRNTTELNSLAVAQSNTALGQVNNNTTQGRGVLEAVSDVVQNYQDNNSQERTNKMLLWVGGSVLVIVVLAMLLMPKKKRG